MKMIYRLVLPATTFFAFAITALFLFITGWTNNWSVNSLKFFIILGLFIGLAAILFSLLRIRRKRTLLVFTVILLLVFGIGVVQLLSVTLLFFSSFLIGRWFLGAARSHSVSASSMLTIGLAIYVLVFSVASRFAINTQIFYILLLLFPFVLVFRELNDGDGTYILQKCKSFHLIIESSNYISLSFFVFLFTYISSYAFFPTVMWDDSVMHLSIWTQLFEFHYYRPDVVSQIWSAEPFNSDLLHGVVSILSQGDARGALNFFLLCVICVAVFKLAGHFVGNNDDKLLVLSLFLTTPLICNLLASLQTDLFLAFLLITGVLNLSYLNNKFSLAHIISVLFIAATCASTKLPALLLSFGLTLTLMLIVSRHFNEIKRLSFSDWGLFGFTFFLSVLLATYPYINAYLLTKNPVFPLYNGFFKSPYFDPKNFLDPLYNKGANVKSFFGIFFDTSHYFEGEKYTAGFQYFLLFPLAVIILIFKKHRAAFFLLTPLFCYAIPLFATLQYWRYFFAVLPLCSVILAIFLVNSIGVAISRIVFYLFIFLNLLFLPGISWLFYTAPAQLYTNEQKEAFAQDIAPENLLNKKINDIDIKAKVLFDLNRPYGGTLAGTPFYNAWYSPKNAKVIADWKSSGDVSNSLKLWGVEYVYMDMAKEYSKMAIQRNAIREFLVDNSYPLFQSGRVTLYKTTLESVGYSNILAYKSFTDMADFDVTGRPFISDLGLVVSSADVVTKVFSVQSFTAFKYSVDITCSKDKEEFVAQINWDKGPPYYKLVECTDGGGKFTETGLIPPAASTGILHLSARMNGQITVKSISVGVR